MRNIKTGVRKDVFVDRTYIINYGDYVYVCVMCLYTHTHTYFNYSIRKHDSPLTHYRYKFLDWIDKRNRHLRKQFQNPDVVYLFTESKFPSFKYRNNLDWFCIETNKYILSSLQNWKEGGDKFKKWTEKQESRQMDWSKHDSLALELDELWMSAPGLPLNRSLGLIATLIPENQKLLATHLTLWCFSSCITAPVAKIESPKVIWLMGRVKVQVSLSWLKTGGKSDYSIWMFGSHSGRTRIYLSLIGVQFLRSQITRDVSTTPFLICR